MDPQAMRHCMGFGFSDKKSDSAIGRCMNLSLHSLNSLSLVMILQHISQITILHHISLVMIFEARIFNYDSASHRSL